MRVRLVAVAVLLSPGWARGGDVSGTVRYAGPAPVAPPLEVTKDRATCGASQPDESLLVEGGGLANAVVSLPPIPGLRLAPATLALSQERCRFAPRVQAAPVGSTLEVVSGDPTTVPATGDARLDVVYER